MCSGCPDILTTKRKILQTTRLGRLPGAKMVQSQRQEAISLFFILAVTMAVAFTFTTAPVHHRPIVRRSGLSMGGGEGRSSTLEGKKEKVERVKSLLDTSEMIFAVPGNSLAVAEVQNLRRSLPNGTTMSVVKNKLMARALEGTPHEPASSLLKGENMWFFIEEEIGSSIRAFNTFSNDSGKEETHSPKGGCLDKQLLDRDSIAHIATLPSKIELITKIASGINAVPLKLARAIKAPGAKLGRAINLATTAKEE